MSDKLKLILASIVTLGAFAVAGVGVYQDQMTVTAALATALAALSSAGVLSSLFPAKEPPEEG